jgi:hypothetical protein
MDAEDISGYGISGTLSIMGTQKYKDESTGEYKEREAEIASVDYQWDSTNKNYVVDMYFDGSPFYSTVIHFAPHWSPCPTIFEGFCQYPRKWHILPTLSRLQGYLGMLRKRKIWPIFPQILITFCYILYMFN